MQPMDINESALDAGWRKASRSVSNGACVEAASSRAAVLVRDSLDRSGLVVRYDAQAWRLFLDTAKVGAFDGIR
jgi:hypothetical protein